MAKASSSQPPKLKSTKKSLKEKAPQAISPEEVPSDVDSDNLDEPMDKDGSSSSSSSSDSESEVDSEENLEDATPRKSTKVVNAVAEKRGKSLRKYEPPIGMTELKVSSAFTSSPFEWDNLASKPGVELWAIRVPKDLKPSRLSSLQLSIPSSSHSQITGSLKTKTHSYTLSTAGTNIHTKAQINEEGRQPTAGPGAIDSMIMDVDDNVPGEMKVEGGEEMDGLRLLVPKIKEGGKLFVASKPITRKLILTPSLFPSSTSTSTTTDELPLPSFLSNPTSNPAITQESPATQTKRAQPTHLLKFRNQAYGFTTPGPEHTVVKGMDVDGAQDSTVEEKDQSSSQIEGDKKEKKEKETKEKKRKNENGDSPKKKSKKSKD